MVRNILQWLTNSLYVRLGVLDHEWCKILRFANRPEYMALSEISQHIILDVKLKIGNSLNVYIELTVGLWRTASPFCASAIAGNSTLTESLSSATCHNSSAVTLSLSDTCWLLEVVWLMKFKCRSWQGDILSVFSFEANVAYGHEHCERPWSSRRISEIFNGWIRG